MTMCALLPPSRMVQTWTFVPVADSLDRSIRQKDPGFSLRNVNALPSQGMKYGRTGGGIAWDEFDGSSSRVLNFPMVRWKLIVVMIQVRRHVVSRMSGTPKRICWSDGTFVISSRMSSALSAMMMIKSVGFDVIYFGTLSFL